MRPTMPPRGRTMTMPLLQFLNPIAMELYEACGPLQLFEDDEGWVVGLPTGIRSIPMPLMAGPRPLKGTGGGGGSLPVPGVSLVLDESLLLFRLGLDQLGVSIVPSCVLSVVLKLELLGFVILRLLDALRWWSSDGLRGLVTRPPVPFSRTSSSSTSVRSWVELLDHFSEMK